MAYFKIAWNDRSAKCSCVSNYFCFVWWSRLVGSSARTYEKRSVFSIFSSWGTFPQVFGQFKEWLMLKLRKIIILSHVVACPIVFFYEQSCQGIVFKVMKNDDFLVLSAVCVFFPKILGRLRSTLYYSWMKW